MLIFYITFVLFTNYSSRVKLTQKFGWIVWDRWYL